MQCGFFVIYYIQKLGYIFCEGDEENLDLGDLLSYFEMIKIVEVVNFQWKFFFKVCGLDKCVLRQLIVFVLFNLQLVYFNVQLRLDG